MVSLTNKEGEVLLKLFKDFSTNYNANSLSKEIGLSSRGALKILKKLEKGRFVIGKRLGKATFYKLNLNELYIRKTLETLLIGESIEKAQRWIDEFRPVFIYAEIIIIYGSIIKNPKNAGDVDIIIVLKKQNYKKISSFIQEKNKVFFKKIHDIHQTIDDLKENLKKNPAVIDSLRTGYILHGQDKIIEVIKDVSGI